CACYYGSSYWYFDVW
nr:immunoglobulin heavy chain junction region [Mus musculus]